MLLFFYRKSKSSQKKCIHWLKHSKFILLVLSYFRFFFFLLLLKINVKRFTLIAHVIQMWGKYVRPITSYLLVSPHYIFELKLNLNFFNFHMNKTDMNTTIPFPRGNPTLTLGSMIMIKKIIIITLFML